MIDWWLAHLAWFVAGVATGCVACGWVLLTACMRSAQMSRERREQD